MNARVRTSYAELCSVAARFGRDETASVSMEYGLVGTLISVAIIGALSATTTGIGDKWNSVANSINAYLR